MQIRTVGVLGCGLMGAGIAQVSAAAGYRTVVREVDDTLLQKGLGRIKGFLDKLEITEILERRLQVAGLDVEVMRFGMDGAPLSQYLQMLRREVRAFKPDIVLVQLIHNDFDETYRFLKTRYASSFTSTAQTAQSSFSPIALAIRALPTNDFSATLRAEFDSRYRALRTIAATGSYANVISSKPASTASPATAANPARSASVRALTQIQPSRQ